MLSTSSSHFLSSESTNTIEHIVLKSPRAFVIQSQGDGFGSYIERLMNVAYETHRSFSNLIETLNDLINYIRKELEQSYPEYQFSIIVGKYFDFDQISSNYFALIEHGGIKVLIFSSIGCSYKIITTVTDDTADNLKSLPW